MYLTFFMAHGREDLLSCAQSVHIIASKKKDDFGFKPLADCCAGINNWTRVHYVTLERAQDERGCEHSGTYITDFIFDLSDVQQHGCVMDCRVASWLGLVVFQLIKYLKEK